MLDSTFICFEGIQRLSKSFFFLYIWFFTTNAKCNGEKDKREQPHVTSIEFSTSLNAPEQAVNVKLFSSVAGKLLLFIVKFCFKIEIIPNLKHKQEYRKIQFRQDENQQVFVLTSPWTASPAF